MMLLPRVSAPWPYLPVTPPGGPRAWRLRLACLATTAGDQAFKSSPGSAAGGRVEPRVRKPRSPERRPGRHYRRRVRMVIIERAACVAATALLAAVAFASA